MSESITFVAEGKTYALSRKDVLRHLAGVVPEPARQHTVLVDGREFPVKQALAVALGLSHKPFNAHTARRYLDQLGFETHGDVRHRDGTVGDFGDRLAGAVEQTQRRVDDVVEWATEERVQDLLMDWLRLVGYEIARFANTSTKEHGVDVIAVREGETIGFEVKGWPSKVYADPRRARETKRTSPTTQAGHWYSQAILAAMKLRTAQPSWRSAIALPDYPRYRRLHAKTIESLDASQIEVVFVSEDGTVDSGSSA